MNREIKISLVMIVALILLPPAILDVKRLSQRVITYFDTQINRNSGIDYEQNQLTTRYYDFFGWRRKEFHGSNININSDGFRVHSNTNLNDAEILVFGGSTIWGTGVSDQSTVPAYLEKAIGRSTFNMGETAFTSQQNLNLLIKAISNGAKPKTVIFYDGVNDVGHKCRVESDGLATFQEQQFRKIIEEKTTLNTSYTFKIIQPSIEATLKAITTLLYSLELSRQNVSDVSQPRSSFFNCGTDAKKVNKVVTNFVSVWAAAKQVCDANGIKFIPILQPLAYVGNPNLDNKPQIKSDVFLKSQYDAIYPEIRKSLLEHKFVFFDLSGALDEVKDIYTDFCHLNDKGNQIIANRIRKIINNL